MANDNAPSTKLDRLRKKQESKFNAIAKQADRWHKRFEGHSGDDNVVGMLGEFRAFLCNYWNFLLDTGDGAAPTSSLEMVRDLSTALALVNNQWTTVSRACEQRMDEDLRDVMAAIDEQASEYYDRFTGYKRSNLPIVYFDKLAAISRSDFLTYPLLSIPLSDIDPKNRQSTQTTLPTVPTVRWESSLAHELGHYIYWNSLKYLQVSVAHENLRRAVIQEFIARYAKTDNYEDIRKGISLLEIWSRWIEEVFADICGTLIEGPDYAESALDMTLEAP
ncbi:MAG TPA: hypothetical protein VL334_20450, partial [Anaerolineae bacterium]|nr:hypothetical protein [Anaerolineae bacterium]